MAWPEIVLRKKRDSGDKLETVVTIRPAYCADIRTKPEERPRQPNLGLISDKPDLRRAWWAGILAGRN
jgi:hypothetical protein